MSPRPTRDPYHAGSGRAPVCSRILPVLLALAVAACGSPDEAGEEQDVADAETAAADSAPLPEDPLFHPASEAMQRTAPDTFRVRFGTTAGSFTIEAYRPWAPRGVDRFYNLARHGFYEGARFFRVIEGFVAQFGLSGRPRLDLAWRSVRIEDDSVRQSNDRGTVSFASSGDDSRTTQLFVNLVDNPRLDGMGFAPIGRVVEGMEVVDDLYAGYAEPPSQPRIMREGNAFLDEAFPELDAIQSAEIVEDDGGMGNEAVQAEPPVEVTLECNSAFRRAASISDLEDTVEELDPAIHACSSVDEWKAAARRHPNALDGIDPEVFLRNRCDFGGVQASLCGEVLQP